MSAATENVDCKFRKLAARPSSRGFRTAPTNVKKPLKSYELELAYLVIRYRPSRPVWYRPIKLQWSQRSFSHIAKLTWGCPSALFLDPKAHVKYGGWRDCLPLGGSSLSTDVALEKARSSVWWRSQGWNALFLPFESIFVSNEPRTGMYFSSPEKLH